MDVRLTAWAGYELKDYTITTVSGGELGNGTIELEYGWQMVSIPIEYGYWDTTTSGHIHDGSTPAKFKNYVLDQITDLYGSGVVEVANTYFGDNQFFYSYVVGSTPENSPHNFELVYDDGGNKEITGWWIKVIGNSAPYIISWGEA